MTRWVLSLLASFALPAQPQDSLLTELEATQRRAADRSITLREREQAVDKAMELRARAIAEARPDDPKLPGYLMDNAAAELARLGREGSDTAVLFGIPLPAQSEAVQQGAGRAVELLDRAGAILAERWKNVEGNPPDDADRLQVEQDRTVRIPFFLSRAKVLLGAGLPAGAERRRLAQSAFESVGKLILLSAAPESIRRVTIGAALLMRSEDPADLQAAIDEFGWVLTGAEGGKPQAGASPVTRAEAWYGLIAAAGALGKLDSLVEEFSRAQQREPFVTADGRADALLAVLAADTITRAWVDRALATQDRAHLDHAVNAQQALLRRNDLPIRAESLRPLVYQKLHLVGRRVEGMDLPPAMDLATAVEATRVPTRREEAIRSLQAVADSPESGDFAADALWELAVLRAQGTRADRLRAVADLTRLARDFSSHPRASEAMSAALAYAHDLAGDSPEATGQYRKALALATDKFPELSNIDAWRYEFGRILADRAGVPVEDARAALAALRQVPASAKTAEDTARLIQRMQSLVLDDGWRRFNIALREKRHEDAIRLCREEILPEARIAVSWATRTNSPGLDRFRADLADALTECGDSGGRLIYDNLIAREVEVPGSWPRLRLGLARSHLILGKPDTAFALLRDLATALDAEPVSEPSRKRSEVFWHAWVLMLEELTLRNTDGSRTATIRSHIKRLETIDPELGGEPWKSRISTIRIRAYR